MKDEKKEIEELLAMLPELPQGFMQWCEDQMENAPVFYRRVGNYTECQCGICGEKYRLHTPKEQEYEAICIDVIPRRKQKTECPKCKTQTYYEWKRVTKRQNEEKWFYLYQLLKDGSVVVRIFNCWRCKKQGTKQKTMTEEAERIFLIKGQVKKMAYVYYYYSNVSGWTMVNGQGCPRIKNTNGPEYPGWEKVLEESALKYCDMRRIADAAGKGTLRPLDRLEILMAYANNPAIEMYEKAGMKKLVRTLVWREGAIGSINRRKTTLSGQLRLKDKQRIKKFIESEGNTELLEILQYEEKHGYRWTEEQERWVENCWGVLKREKTMDTFMKYMSIQKLINRVETYRKGRTLYGSARTTLTEYKDYLEMREELGYNMKNEVFIYPKNLHEKHQEMVEEKNARENELTIRKKNKEYPQIAEKYQKLCKRYQARTEGYILRPAKNAGEIIMEGRTLHHCVGRDVYLKKHNDGKTTILFLRKEKCPDKPYITIEIEGNRILQWYGINDTKPDKEVIGKLLEDYVEQLKNNAGRTGRTKIEQAV